MKIQIHFTVCKRIYSLVLGFILFGNFLLAQTPLTEYVIFGGQKKTTTPAQTAPLAPGYAVQIGPTNTIQGGSIGSYNLVKSTGNLTLGATSNPTNVHSGGIIQLANSNVVTGKITAANTTTLPSPLPPGSTILSIGSSAMIGGNIDVNGNIVIGGGTVSGNVTHPAGTTYSGPVPVLPAVEVIGTPTLPTLPDLPAPTSYPVYPSGSPFNFSSSQKINPGYSYGDITLNGNKTLTFNGPGIYVINSIKNSGTSNNFVFNLKNQIGNIRVYVRGNVDLGKIKASIDSVITYGGGPAKAESRIYLETQGLGVSASNPVAFGIANGSAGNASKWVGTVYAPFAAINIGSGTGSTNVTGALWSGTQVNLQSGIFMEFAPFTFCDPPNINVGPDRPLSFSSFTTLKDSSGSATSYLWETIGGLITGPIDNSTGAVILTRDSIQVSSAGIYILKASSATNCFVSDTILVTSRLKSIIGSELQSIYDNKITDNTFFDIKNGYVTIDVIVNKPDSLAYVQTLLQTPPYGLKNIQSNGESKFIITGEFPINNLPKLNFLVHEINYCMPHNYGVTYNGFDMIVVDTILGKVRTAGDTSIRSYLVRKGYNLTGEGVKIGIISNSYNTIAFSNPSGPIKTYNEADGRKNGDLPDLNKPYTFSKPVTVLKDLPINPPRSDEGRAMAEVIHDVAPGAELYFHTGSVSAGDFALGIKKLDSAGCNVIVDDITYITEPFLKDGVVANAVDTAKKHGVSYYSAAGNFASKSYGKIFDSLPAPVGFPAGAMAHNFGGAAINDIYDSVTLFPGPCTIVLQWLDSIHSTGQGGTKYDLDIYLTPKTDGTALFGFNRDNTDGDPIEFIPFMVDSITKTNILIVNKTTGKGQPSRVKIIVFRGDIKFNEHMTADVDSSTVTGQSNAAGAITIGAARYDNTSSIEYYSSTGGTVVKGQPRQKPDLVGPDGVNTTVKMGNLDYDGDLYYNFFGTSAAAPHAAAVTALIMEGRKIFLPHHPGPSSTNTPDTIRALLDSTATEMYSPNFDYKSGYGFLNVDMAMRTIAEPTPFLIELVVPPNTIPGTVPFILTITGENFSDSSKVVIVDGDDTTYIPPQTIFTNVLTVAIDTFTQSPEVLVYTPPKTDFGDGGFSNSLNFFDADVVVTAVSDTITYGQPIPVFDTIITVDGVLLQNTNLTLDSLGLGNLTLLCNATATSNVDDYDITPVIPASTPIPDSLLKKYNYKFVKGHLTIEKLPVTVTAQDVTVTYGEQLPNIEFTYAFDTTGILNPGALLNQILSVHQNQLAKDELGHDILGLVNDQAVVIENDQAVVIENDQAVVIENGHTYALRGDSARLIINDTTLTITNGVVTGTDGYTLTAGDIANLNFLASEESLNDFRTVNSTKVIDITQESILGFIKNGAQTTMLNSVSNVNPKGLLDIQSYTSEQAVVIENDQAVVIENGIPRFDLANEQAVTIENGSIINDQAVVIENDQAVVIENGVAVPIYFSQNRTAVIVDSSETRSADGPSELTSLNIVSGFEVGEHFILPASLAGSPLSNNLAITYVPGKLTVTKDTITVTANNVSKQYLDPNPELTVTYSGFAQGEDLENSDITGIPVVSTTITSTTPVGVYPNQIIVTQGTLASSNYAFKFVNGTFTVTANPCLLVRPPFNNFGSTPTPQSQTSLWVNVEIKVSGQLKTHGRYLLFTKGAITLNDIDATDWVTGLPLKTKDLPNGKVMADSNVKNAAQIYTQYDSTNNLWTTYVPLGFSSTSDIFITGGIINSSDGFVKKKKNSNSNTVVQGIFYSDTVYADQWTYALATYRPIFYYAYIAGTAGTGKVVPINGTYRAGTPLSAAGTPINTLVNGGSGGGGNSYTGSTTSYDNFTACCPACPAPETVIVSSSSGKEKTNEEVQVTPTAGEVSIIPNPASDYINLSFVPTRTGISKIVLYTIDGRKVVETDNGICEAGKNYMRKIDVSKLINGVYVVQLRGADKITIKKIIVSR